jgi:beta-barrel assembly-enhancing protease
VGNKAEMRRWHDSGAGQDAAGARRRDRVKRLPPTAWPRRLGLVLTLAAAIALPAQAPQAQVRLPSLGESANEDFTVSVERRLGEQIMRDIRRDPDYLDDPPLLEYLQSLWQPLVAEARELGEITPDTDQQLAWESFLVRDRSVNAFALPGGYVGVHLGLIAMTSTRDELASVLAHELSHITQRHIARSIASSQRQSIVSMAALILGVLAASRSNSGDMAQAAILGSQAAAAQGQLNFSRDMEREADRVGFGVLVGAGFSSSGMASMFEKLDAASRLDSSSFPYLLSHPLTTERIADARARIMLPGGRPMSESLLHPLMQARARVLMDTSVQTLHRLQQPVTGPQALRERLGLLYAAALASSILREPAVADARVDEALRLAEGADPADPQAVQALRLLKGQLLVDRGDAARAAQWLDAMPAGPGRRAPMLLRAQAALGQVRIGAPDAAKDLHRSTEALQTWLAEHRQDATAWGLLAQCADVGGFRLRALRAQAEERAALGDLAGAVDRLRAGQALARSGGSTDFIEASVIDARLRELQGQRRQIAADLRGGKAPRDEGDPPPE